MEIYHGYMLERKSSNDVTRVIQEFRVIYYEGRQVTDIFTIYRFHPWKSGQGARALYKLAASDSRVNTIAGLY